MARFRDASARDRLRERSCRRSVMAPKKAREVGELGAAVGDICPKESTDFWESMVEALTGGVGWKFGCSCDAILTGYL